MKGRMPDHQRLLHLLDAIAEIEQYTKDTDFSTFDTNSMMRFASVKQIEIIGEAANNLLSATRELSPSTEWKQIIGLRHILVHEYFGIDSQIIWQIITIDLPRLKSDVVALLEMLKE